jgi:hypothetical protein
MQSIFTKYSGATNYRGSRIKATSSSGHSVTVSWDHGLGVDDNHDRAALALAKKLGWHGRMYRGGDKGGKGNVYVFGEGGSVLADSSRRRRTRRRKTRK